MSISITNNANKLQQEALKVFRDLNLENVINDAEVKLVGSVVYNLMTWRDLDIDIRTTNTPSNTDYFILVQHLFSNKHISKILLVDNRQQLENERPKSMYIGLSYLVEGGNTWKIDIRLLAKSDAMTDTIEQLIKEEMTEENRINILKIKDIVKENPNYHKKFSSVDIYKVVLENGVTSYDDFIEYLGSLGKSLQ